MTQALQAAAQLSCPPLSSVIDEMTSNAAHRKPLCKFLRECGKASPVCGGILKYVHGLDYLLESLAKGNPLNMKVRAALSSFFPLLLHTLNDLKVEQVPEYLRELLKRIASKVDV